MNKVLGSQNTLLTAKGSALGTEFISVNYLSISHWLQKRSSAIYKTLLVKVINMYVIYKFEVNLRNKQRHLNH